MSTHNEVLVREVFVEESVYVKVTIQEVVGESG